MHTLAHISAGKHVHTLAHTVTKLMKELYLHPDSQSGQDAPPRLAQPRGPRALSGPAPLTVSALCHSADKALCVLEADRDLMGTFPLKTN